MICMAQADPRAKVVESALTRHGLSLRWMAEKIGTSHQNVGAWLSGESRPRNPQVFTQMLEAISEYEQSMRRQPGDITVRRVGIRQIPIYSGISAGMPGSVTSDVELVDVMDWGNGYERWGRIVMGFSMSPELEPGDTVIIEARPWQPGHVVQAFDDGEDCIKVARGHGSSARLVPANPEYPVIDGRRMNVKGVVVERWEHMGSGVIRKTLYPHGMRSNADRPLENS